MDKASLFFGMWRASETFREDMTIEEAIEILHPVNERKFSGSYEEQLENCARYLKARNVLIQYVRGKESKEMDHPKQEKENNDANGGGMRT